MTYLLEKPFDVRPWETLKGIETEAGVFHQHWPIHLNCSQSSLFFGDIFGLSLELWQVELQGVEGYGLAQDVSDLLELFSVAGDEGDRA